MPLPLQEKMNLCLIKPLHHFIGSNRENIMKQHHRDVVSLILQCGKFYKTKKFILTKKTARRGGKKRDGGKTYSLKEI